MERAPESISESELIAAILAAQESTSSCGLTAPEIAQAAGLGIALTRRRLQAMKAAGQVEVVRVARCNLADVWGTYPGYVLTSNRV